MPRVYRSVSVRVRVIAPGRRRRALATSAWRTLRVTGARATAPVAHVKASQVQSAPIPGQPGVVVLTGEQAVRSGEVLALGIGPATPNGLLARIVAVTQTPAGTAAVTVPATLPEVIASGELDLRITSVDLHGPRVAPRLPVGHSVDCDGGATLTANGSAALSADIDLYAGWRFPFKLNARFGGNINARADVSASVSGQASCTLPASALLPTPIRLGAFELAIGPIPIVVVTQGSLYLAANANAQAAISTSATASLTATAGINYDHGFSAFGGLTPNLTWKPPTLTASGTAQAALTPTVDVLIDGIAGPRIELGTGLKLAADITATPWWNLTAPLALAAQLRLDIFKLQLASDRLTVFSAEPKLADSTTPKPAAEPAPTDAGLPAPKPPSTSSHGVRACGDQLYKPARGSALLIDALRARNVTCATALEVAGANSAGDAKPAGWHCSNATPRRTVCTRKNAYVSYVFGGDAG